MNKKMNLKKIIKNIKFDYLLFKMNKARKKIIKSSLKRIEIALFSSIDTGYPTNDEQKEILDVAINHYDLAIKNLEEEIHKAKNHIRIYNE